MWFYKKSIDYYKEKQHLYVAYLDANNLGGWESACAYWQFLLLNRKAIDKCDIISNTGKHGYILKLGFQCPQKLHAFHHFLPLASES